MTTMNHRVFGKATVTVREITDGPLAGCFQVSVSYPDRTGAMTVRDTRAEAQAWGEAQATPRRASCNPDVQA